METKKSKTDIEFKFVGSKFRCNGGHGESPLETIMYETIVYFQKIMIVGHTNDL